MSDLVIESLKEQIGYLERDIKRYENEKIIHQRELDRYQKYIDEFTNKIKELKKAIKLLQTAKPEKTVVMWCDRCDDEVSCSSKDTVDKNGLVMRGLFCPNGHWLKWETQDIPYEEYRMPFGKHQGKRIQEVPKPYIKYLLKDESRLKGNLKEYLERALQ